MAIDLNIPARINSLHGRKLPSRRIIEEILSEITPSGILSEIPGEEISEAGMQSFLRTHDQTFQLTGTKEYSSVLDDERKVFCSLSSLNFEETIIRIPKHLRQLQQILSKIQATITTLAKANYNLCLFSAHLTDNVKPTATEVIKYILELRETYPTSLIKIIATNSFINYFRETYLYSEDQPRIAIPDLELEGDYYAWRTENEGPIIYAEDQIKKYVYLKFTKKNVERATRAWKVNICANTALLYYFQPKLTQNISSPSTSGNIPNIDITGESSIPNFRRHYV